jgi:hypothetical protein
MNELPWRLPEQYAHHVGQPLPNRSNRQSFPLISGTRGVVVVVGHGVLPHKCRIKRLPQDSLRQSCRGAAQRRMSRAADRFAIVHTASAFACSFISCVAWSSVTCLAIAVTHSYCPRYSSVTRVIYTRCGGSKFDDQTLTPRTRLRRLRGRSRGLAFRRSSTTRSRWPVRLSKCRPAIINS